MTKISYIHKNIKGIKKYLHRHVMEEHLGRKLEYYEHVYHINGDPKDNRVENLVVVKKHYNKPPKPRKKTYLEELKEELEYLKIKIKEIENQ